MNDLQNRQCLSTWIHGAFAFSHAHKTRKRAKSRRNVMEERRRLDRPVMQIGRRGLPVTTDARRLLLLLLEGAITFDCPDR